MDLKKIAEKINILGDYCGMRDVEALSQNALMDCCGFRQADVLILFGGSIPYGCDVVGDAITREHIAKKVMIVGGEGHTTESLRQKIKSACPQIETAGKMEADVIGSYLKWKYGIVGCLIERESTNCGNNVTNALMVMKRHGINPASMIIVQDATMQRRMDAGFRKYADSGIRIINFAAYRVRAIVENGTLTLQPADLWGMWDVRQYVTLLMGEIPRLTDHQEGYGPRGRAYIAHVEIPREVADAFVSLKKEYGDYVRTANPSYATK